MFPRRLLVITCLCATIFRAALAEEPKSAAEPEGEFSPAAVRVAVEKSLPLLTRGAAGHREQRTCFACHNQGVAILALTAAKQRGLAIDDEEFARQLQFIADFLATNRERYLEGKGQGGQADTAGYALVTLAAGQWPAEATTTAVVEYLLVQHRDRDHWRNTSNRPPSEASPFTTTYLALRSLASFGQAEHAERIEARREQVRGWLASAEAKDNEDRVFRLLTAAAAKADPPLIEAAAKELMGKQRADGGWAQLDAGEPLAALASDAYATGTALYALHEAGALGVNSPVYRRGIAYLLQSQQADGSWHVISRSKPFQTYFETGFPHGKDQFISAAASAWATWALVACLPAESSSQNSLKP